MYTWGVVYPDIDPVLLSLGPLQIRWYGLAYLLGIALPGILFKDLFRKRLGLTVDDLLNMMTYLIIGIILGGRLGYILFYDFAYYSAHPASVLALWRGGMSYHGGGIGALVGILLFAHKYKLSKLFMMDLLALFSTIGIFFGRLANFINGELYGRTTTAAIGMVFPQGGALPRHPSQLYEAFFEGFLLFVILYFTFKRLSPKPGTLFGLYLCFYGIFRFGIEFFREPDSHLGLLLFNFSMGQWLCIGEFIAGILWLLYLRKRV